MQKKNCWKIINGKINGTIFQKKTHFVDVYLRWSFSRTHRFYFLSIKLFELNRLKQLVPQRVQFSFENNIPLLVCKRIISWKEKYVFLLKSTYVHAFAECSFVHVYYFKYLYPLHYTTCLCTWFILWDSYESPQKPMLFGVSFWWWKIFRSDRRIRFNCIVSHTKNTREINATKWKYCCANFVEVKVKNLFMFYGE